jgi:DNA modification methylase
MLVDITKLKISSYYSSLYLVYELSDLVESIKESGLLEKIKVKDDFTIISGVRRYLALLELNFKEADVEIINVNASEELFTIISFNKQRIKTNRELLNEASQLKEILAQKRGRKSKLLNVSTANTKPVDTRKTICNKLNVSAGNLNKLEYINQHRPKLIELIDQGKISINQAHLALARFEESKNELLKIDVLPTTLSTDSYIIYNKSSDDLSDLESESIQTIFTSPPYWDQRIFTSSTNELGSEETSETFVQKIAKHLQQCYRVLKNDGSFFLNMGDKYKHKNLECIPHRIVIELQKNGWILRNAIIWKKNNPLPSTTIDNLTPSYEFIFHLVKSRDYYFNQYQIPAIESNVSIATIENKSSKGKFVIPNVAVYGLKSGKKIEDYWTEDIVSTATASQNIAKKYGSINHPAPFPPEISILPILETSRPGDIVMDPFSGTATVGEMAILNGRKFVGYELNPNHNEVQKKRLNDAIKAYNDSTSTTYVKEAA